MGEYDDNRYRDEEGEFIFDPEMMPDQDGDEEWQVQDERASSPVRKRLKKLSSHQRSSDHGDEEWQVQDERASSPVRKRRKKLSSHQRSSDDDEDQLSKTPAGSGSRSTDDDQGNKTLFGSGSRSTDDDQGNKTPSGSGSRSTDDDQVSKTPAGSGIRSSDDDQVKKTRKRSKLKQAGKKKRKLSKSSAPEVEEMWKFAARADVENEESEDDIPLLTGSDAAPGRYAGPPMPDIPALVERFIAQLEVAAEEDAELNRQSMPAINKLRLLPRFTQVLSKRPLQCEFMDRGILSVLKNWLEPLPDQSLPNTTLRTGLLNILANLPIDTGDHERREQLKSSGLGRVVMFLSRSEEETVANKRLARTLVDNWSRPLFQNPTRLDDQDLRYLNSKAEQKRPPGSEGPSHGELESDDFDLEALKEQHTRESKARDAAGSQTVRPEAIAADFVFRPSSKIDPEEVRARAKLLRKDKEGSKGRLQHMMKKLQTRKRKPQGFKPIPT